MPQRFDSIRESLLRDGVAPRHVNRYTRELRDHFDDLLREEIGMGNSPELAEASARRRLGSDDVLIRAVLGRPELRSVVARHPLAFFGIGPVVVLVVTIVFAVIVQHEFVVAHEWVAEALGSANSVPGVMPPGWVRTTVALWNGAMTYVVPLAIAAVVCLVGTRQRMPLRWTMAGATTVLVFGAFHFLFAKWSNIPHQSSIDVSYIGPGYTRDMIHLCLERLAANLCILAAAYWFWLRQPRAVSEPHEGISSPSEMSA